MTELTLLDLNSSKELAEELNIEESKSIIGGQEPAEPSGGSSGGGETGGSEPPDHDGDCRTPPGICDV